MFGLFGVKQMPTPRSPSQSHLHDSRPSMRLQGTDYEWDLCSLLSPRANFNVASLDDDLHLAAVRGVEDPRAVCLERRGQVGRVFAPSAADDDPGGGRPVEKPGDVPGAAAVVGSHHHVAGQRRTVEQRAQPRAVQIAGQENPAIGELDQQHHAVRVVAVIESGLRWQQHVGPRRTTGRQTIAGPDRNDWDPREMDHVEQMVYGRIAPLGHYGRHAHGSDGKPIHQPRQGVVVVGVGVREDNEIEPVDPAGPERRGNRLGRRAGRTEPARVVQSPLPAGQFEQDRRAVPHADKRARQPLAAPPQRVGSQPG